MNNHLDAGFGNLAQESSRIEPSVGRPR